MKVAAARSVGFDTLSLSHIRQEKVTNVMYYSLGDEMNVFDNLLAEPERCLQPTFFAAVLYRCHQQRLENYRKTLDRALIHIEERSKFGGPGRLFGREFGRSSRADDPGGDLTLKLSYMQTEIAIAGHLARACEKCGAGIAEIAERDESCVMNGVDVDDEKLHTYHTRGFDLDSASATSSEVQYIRRRAETVVSQLQGIQDRVQSQTTFVGVPTSTLVRLADALQAPQYGRHKPIGLHRRNSLRNPPRQCRYEDHRRAHNRLPTRYLRRNNPQYGHVPVAAR
jgi:hypothetical protein